MSWLDFANHFLSNQRLHAWSWINRTFPWEWFVFFLWGIWLWVFGPFPFLFLFSVRWTSHRRTGFLVGNQRERTTLDRGFLSLFLFTRWQLFIVQMLSGPMTFLHISSVFLPILDREFSFYCFLPIFDWELSLFSFFYSFLPRARMDILTLGQGLW